MPEKITVLRNGTSWKNALLYGATLNVCIAGIIFDRAFFIMIIALFFLILSLVFNKLNFSSAQITETTPWKSVLGFFVLFFALLVPLLAKDSGITFKWLVVEANTFITIIAARYFISFQHRVPREGYEKALKVQTDRKERNRLYRKGTLR